MTKYFDIFCEDLLEKLELNIARSQDRKHLHQIPVSARAQTFKSNYNPKTKTSRSIISVAKGATAGNWKISKLQAIDLARKYEFNVPNSSETSKHLGSTGIIMYWQPPDEYRLVKK